MHNRVYFNDPKNDGVELPPENPIDDGIVVPDVVD